MLFPKHPVVSVTFVVVSTSPQHHLCIQEEAPNAVEAVTQPEAETEASHPQLDSDAPTVRSSPSKAWPVQPKERAGHAVVAGLHAIIATHDCVGGLPQCCKAT